MMQVLSHRPLPQQNPTAKKCRFQTKHSAVFASELNRTLMASRQSTGFSNPLGLRNSDVFKKKQVAASATSSRPPTKAAPTRDSATISESRFPTERSAPSGASRITVRTTAPTPTTSAANGTSEAKNKAVLKQPSSAVFTKTRAQYSDETVQDETHFKTTTAEERLRTSDLMQLEIKLGDSLIFSSLTERHDVAFFRLEKREAELERLQAKLSELKLQPEANVADGLFVLARHKEKIFRGIVKVCNVEANKVVVQLADFGSAAVLRREDIFRAPAEALSEAPTRFCRALRLQDVSASESNREKEELARAAAVLSKHQPFLVEKVTAESNLVAVTLRSKLSDRFHAEFESALRAVETDRSRDDDVELRKAFTQVGSRLVGYVTHIDSENCIFHFLTLQDCDVVAEIDDKLGKLYAGQAAPSRGTFQPRMGQLVVVLDEDESYKRARVESLQGSNFVCQLVDYGDEKSFPASVLLPPPPFCKDYPCFARPCRITDSDEDLAFVMFQDLQVLQKEHILVKEVTSHGICHVELGELPS